jgi:peptide deformylase
MEILKPHNKKSRIVESRDLENIKNLSIEMFNILNTPSGLYNRHWACAHPQVEANDPLRFFVLNSLVEKIRKNDELFKNFDIYDAREIIINPVIIRHSKTTIDSLEGCLTFSDLPMVKKQRWYKVEIEYNYLIMDFNDKPVLSKRKRVNLKGDLARVFQHEIDHLNAIYIV